MPNTRHTLGLVVPALNNIYTKLILHGVHSALNALDTNFSHFAW